MLHLQNHAGVAVLRIDHGKAHALDVELCAALRDALADLADDADTRAIVLTGTGTIFCAGVDLVRLLDGGAEYADRFIPLIVETFTALFGFPHPAVAAVNGHAIAGGCVMAAACDYRLMAAGSGTIGVPELRVGVPFPLVAIEILRFATSTAHLQELVYQGKTYGVDDAYGRGLLDEVVPADRLLERAAEVAHALSSEPASRFRITKRQLRQPTLDRIAHLSRHTDADVLAEWKNPATLQAIRDYLTTLRRS